jgi:outer membrane protein assembly factor BamB
VNGGGQRQPDVRWLNALLAALVLGLAARPALAQGDTWQALPHLPTPRRLLAAATAGGRVYTFGGCGSPCFDPLLHPFADEETRVEVFDPGTGSWSGRDPMPLIFFAGAAAAPGDGKIYVLGGETSGGVLAAYDPAADAWEVKAPMPTPRYGLAAVALDGKVYAVGGSGPTGALEGPGDHHL